MLDLVVELLCLVRDLEVDRFGWSGTVVSWFCQMYPRLHQSKCTLVCLVGDLKAEIVETTFGVSRFSDIRLGYDFVPCCIQKKRPETTLV